MSAQSSVDNNDDPAQPSTYRSSLPWHAFNAVSTELDQRFGWDKLALPVSLAVLVGLRNELRRHNLYDSKGLPSLPAPPLPPKPNDATVRTIDGTSNDTGSPCAGMAGSRVGLPADTAVCGSS